MYATTYTVYPGDDYEALFTSQVSSNSPTGYNGWGGYVIGFVECPHQNDFTAVDWTDGVLTLTRKLDYGRVNFCYADFPYMAYDANAHVTNVGAAGTPCLLINKINIHQCICSGIYLSVSAIIAYEYDGVMHTQLNTLVTKVIANKLDYENLRRILNGDSHAQSEVAYNRFVTGYGSMVVPAGTVDLNRLVNGAIDFNGTFEGGGDYTGKVFFSNCEIVSAGIKRDPTSASQAADDTGYKVYGMALNMPYRATQDSAVYNSEPGIGSYRQTELQVVMDRYGNVTLYNRHNYGDSAINDQLLYGGYTAVLSYDDDIMQGVESIQIEQDGCTYIRYQSEGIVYLGIILKAKDIKLQLATYPNFWGYVTKFEGNEATEEVTSDPLEMQEWQLPDNPDGITDDEYDGDIPEPESEDDGSEIDGDVIPNSETRFVGAGANFVTIYDLTLSQLNEFGNIFWGNWLTQGSSMVVNFFWDAATADISRAIDYIVSLRFFPLVVPNSCLYSNTSGLRMGTGHTVFVNDVAALNNYVGVIDCGSCVVSTEKQYNDYRDYDNTTVSIFLPYCGTAELNPGDVIHATLRCKYYVDFSTGACTAVVDSNRMGKSTIVASKSGQIGFMLPVTATNAGQVTAQFINDAANIAQTIGTMVMGVQTMQSGSDAMAAVNQSSKNAASKMAAAERTMKSGEHSIYNASTAGVAQLANGLTRSAVSIPALSGGAGLESTLFSDTPFVTVRRGQAFRHSGYYKTNAFASRSYGKVSDFKGFCVFQNVDVSGLALTYEEQMGIKNLLQSGIYVTHDADINGSREIGITND